MISASKDLDITYGYMPLSDATIFMLDARKPFTASEKTFLEEHILKNNIPTLFFLVNKIDLIDAAQVDNVVNDVANKLKKTLNIDNVCIMPIASELAQRGIFQKDESCLKQSRLIPFKQKLLEFISEGERSISTIKGAKLHVIGLANLFLKEIEIEISQSQKNLDQLQEQLKTLDESKGEIKSHFDEILKYVDTDAAALDARIETALLNRFKELFDSLIVEIDIANGDLTDYAEKILPYKYNQYMETWLENNSQSIEQFLQFTTSNATKAFENSFAKAPLLDLINTKCSFGQTNDLSPIQVSGKEELKNKSTLATIAGGIVAGGLAIFTSGLSLAVVMPSLIGGSFLSGKYITPHFAKQVLEDQKNELKQLLRAKMKSDFEMKIKTLRQSCAEYYVQLKESLEKEFNRVFEDLSFDIQKKIEESSNKNRSSEKRLKELNSLQTSVERVQKEILEIQL